MKYPLSDNTWDSKEIVAIQRVIDSGMFSMGKEVQAFEDEFAKAFNVCFSIMVSSGSAANLLLVAALVYSGKIKKGDEVIVPAVSWSTTYFPLLQFGLKLRFVDINKDTLNIDCGELKKAFTPNTKIVFLVNLLGNSNEFDKILPLCEKRQVLIIEDNCESLGAEYKGKKLGTIGLAGTFSMFYSHHICTMEGGMVVTNDEELYHYMLCIRAHGWTRNLPETSPIYQKSEDAFYESFNFIVPGFNLRPIEIEAAAGREQLKKMNQFIIQRRKNAEYFIRAACLTSGVLIQKEIGKSSWFGFAVILNEEHVGRRSQIINVLSNASIDVRPIVAGNFVRNPVIRYFDYSVSGTLKNADYIHENGFFIGNHSVDNTNEIDYFFNTLKGALN